MSSLTSCPKSSMLVEHLEGSPLAFRFDSGLSGAFLHIDQERPAADDVPQGSETQTEGLLPR